MNFTSEYFLEEEREGFIVQPLMKRVWAAQLEVLHDIDTICKRHQIKYFAQWGTLLGAVRHQGFIPWDDDMDICMLREDVVQFLRYAKQELSQGYRVVNWDDDGYNELMVRVVNCERINLNEDFLDRYHGCPYVVGIDIFCMDHIPRNKGEEEVQLKLLSAAISLGKYWNDYVGEEDGREEQVRELESLTGYHFTDERPIQTQLSQLANKLASMYSAAESDEVALMANLTKYPNKRLPVSLFDDIIEVPFENTSMPIPSNYDILLRMNYGPDYMTPMKKKSSHGYPFFKSQIEQLRALYEKQGVEFPECFDMRYE